MLGSVMHYVSVHSKITSAKFEYQFTFPIYYTYAKFIFYCYFDIVDLMPRNMLPA